VTGVVCSGNIVHDTLLRPVDQVNWGTSMWIESIEQHLGGNGANTAYAIGKLGVPVRLIGAVGHDEFGDRCLEILRSVDVDLSGVARSDLPTAATIVLVNSSGERALLHQPGVSKQAFAEPLNFASPEGTGFSRYHVANFFALALMRETASRTLANARTAGLITSVDTGWDPLGEWMDVLQPCLPHTSLLFVNEEEGRMLSGSGSPDDIARAAQSHGVSDVVVKLGARGCVVFHGEDRIAIPAFPASVIDTTGAGDCFAGAFLAGLVRGLGIVRAAGLACAAAALSIQRLGAVNGLLDYESTLTWMAARHVNPQMQYDAIR
jgi:sugar/nucleoside kinase (ribokinase family)